MSQSQLALASQVSQPNLSAYENGRRSPSGAVVERIRTALAATASERVARHRDEILRLLPAYHATTPRLFGSVARGSAHGASDVDLLVDFTDEATLLDEVGLRIALTDLLQVEVDVVGADALHGDIRERILREAVAL